MKAKYTGMRPSQFDDELSKKLDALLRQAVLQTDTLLKQESPVDTGRFRNSWQIGENATGEYEGDQGTSFEPAKGMNYTVGNEKIGNSYILHNSLPYAEPLATGHSQQADPGWIQQIAKDMQGWVNKNAGNIQ